MLDVLLWLNLASSLFMTGLIWFVQIVHYPLFLRIPSEKVALYAEEHSSRATLVVAPVMLVELAASLLLPFHGPPGVSALWLWALLLMTAANFASTFFVQVPLHAKIARGDLESIPVLVASNWLRTLLWTLRSLLLIGILARPS
jgi:hypothetical protein